MLKFSRWRVDVTVDGDLVKTFYETATTSKAAIDKAKHKLRGAVSNAGAFEFKSTRVEEGREHHAAKKTAQIARGPRTLVKAYVRTYSDSGQTKACVEWGDGSRTEGPLGNAHMEALLKRARREGVRVRHEVW